MMVIVFIESAMANGCQAAFWGQDLVDAPQQLPVFACY